MFSIASEHRHASRADGAHSHDDPLRGTRQSVAHRVRARRRMHGLALLVFNVIIANRPPVGSTSIYPKAVSFTCSGCFNTDGGTCVTCSGAFTANPTFPTTTARRRKKRELEGEERGQSVLSTAATMSHRTFWTSCSGLGECEAPARLAEEQRCK